MSRRRRSVLGLSVYACVRVLQVCEHDMFVAAGESFTKFATLVHLGTKTNWLDLGVKRSEVIARPNSKKTRWEFRRSCVQTSKNPPFRGKGRWFAVEVRAFIFY